MKKIEFILLLVLTSSLFSSCCKEKKDEPTPVILLEQHEVILMVRETREVLLSGGNGNFFAETQNSALVEARTEKNRVILTGKNPGETIVKILSGSASAVLKVIVTKKNQEVPLLESNSALWIGDQRVLVPQILIYNSKGYWLCENSVSPYGNRFFIGSLPSGTQRGDEVELEVVNDGIKTISSLVPITSEPIKKKFLVEYLTPHLQVRLKDSNFRVVIKLNE